MNFNKVPVYMQIAIKQYYEFKWSRRDVNLSVVDDLRTFVVLLCVGRGVVEHGVVLCVSLFFFVFF